MRVEWKKTLCLAAIVMLTATAARAEIRLPALFGDNMVLQRDEPAAVWGTAAPGETVTVAVADQKASARADDKGQWKVMLPKLAAGGPLEMTVTGSSGDAITLKNVLVGEVWVCSGQSNMEWAFARAKREASPEKREALEREQAEARFPRIRLFNVRNTTADRPRRDCQGSWIPCSPGAVENFSMLGYYFGRDLLRELDVPVGLIASDWGGTPAEAWTSREALEAEASLGPLLERWDRSAAASKKAAASKNRPANLYNAMIAPLLPYTLRGVIWYQGESNVTRAYQYRTIFPAMIRCWRAAWGKPDLPFGFVQIAPYRYYEIWRKKICPEIQRSWCAELWEAQFMTLKSVSNTGMVVTTDLGDLNNIHPGNKRDAARRLALWALAAVYGKQRVYSGPIHESMSIEGDRIRLRFDHVGGGLASRDGKPLTHFTIAGEDQKFHPAEARIDGDTIVVHADQVSKPVAVRFAWRDDAEPNLINRAGLPASPFRTDRFKAETFGRSR